MTNPKLSDFTLEQLTIATKAFIAHQMDLKDHVRELRKNPSLASMFKDEIIQFESEIEDLQTLIVQFSWIVVLKQEDQKVASN